MFCTNARQTACICNNNYKRLVMSIMSGLPNDIIIRIIREASQARMADKHDQARAVLTPDFLRSVRGAPPERCEECGKGEKGFPEGTFDGPALTTPAPLLPFYRGVLCVYCARGDAPEEW